MKKLQILVPHYHEEAEVIKPLLDSIAIQQAVDFDEIGVVICHDGEDIKDFDFPESRRETCYTPFPIYPFEIRQIHIPHGGVSAARNGALDASDAEYVMFCDCDDIFYSAVGLWLIFREIGCGDFDSLVSEFVEEIQREDGSTIFIKREKDCTFVHGKVHRRQYLIDNGIRWNDALTVHEDSYFNILCQSLSERVKYCPYSFYLWKWRDESVCRHDSKYILKTFNNLIDSNEALVAEFNRRERPNDAEFYVVQMIFDAYYTMNKPEWIEQENQEYRNATEKRFAAYFRTHKAIWDKAETKNKMIVSNHVRANHVREGMVMETMTISEWLAHIETLA